MKYKYETAREMLQQEIDRHLTQLSAARQQLDLLARIRTDATSATVIPGSIVYTDSGAIYIAVSAGSVTVEGTIFQTVSAASPLGRLLMGRTVGAELNLNGRQLVIRQVL